MLNNIVTGEYGKSIPVLQTLLDVVIIIGVFLILFAFNDLGNFFLKGGNYSLLTAICIAGVVSLISVKGLFEVHTNRMTRAERLFRQAVITAGVSTVFYAAMMMLFGFFGVTFKFFMILFLAQAFLLFISWIVVLQLLKRFRRYGRNTRNVVIIGTGQSAMHLAKLLTEEQGYGMRVVGFFDNRIPSDFDGEFIGTIGKLDEFIKERNVNEIYYASSLDNDILVNKVINLADQNFCKLYFIPMLSPKLQYSFYMSDINGKIPAISVHQSPLRSITNRMIKRAFDIVFSGMVLLLSPIIFIPIAIAIKISSPGPVFFKQLRTGYLGKNFYCYKFRTMRVSKDADTRQATKNDDRKTKLGNFLRHTSLDELPQFWNVFKGDMSVVGPRPHMLAHTEEYKELIDQYMVRHLVKPGITGWAQIQGFRGATDELWQMEKRVDNDVWYIEHWSLSLDLKIIVRTVTNALKGEENAY